VHDHADQPMPEFRLDRELVDAFVAGGLDPRLETELAEQVARLLPLHWSAPNPVAADMSRLIDGLGGERGLLAWLERHPGRPRLIARMYVLVGLLDQISDAPAIVTALTELRAQVPYPPGLTGYLVPATDTDTLANLSGKIEALLGEDRTEEAFRLGVATVAMLQEVAPLAGRLDPEFGAPGDVLERLRRDLIAAAAGD
jgi:hypothetical protein